MLVPRDQRVRRVFGRRVVAWCDGAKFAEIAKACDWYEGSIIRTFHRLEELMRQLIDAAKVVGNEELEQRCAAARNFYGAQFGPIGAQFADTARRRHRYAALLQTKAYRFVGDDTAWQQKGGLEQMTAPKEYVVEVQAGAKEEGQRPEHLLVRFELTYDWLVYCHLVSTVSPNVASARNSISLSFSSYSAHMDSGTPSSSHSVYTTLLT